MLWLKVCIVKEHADKKGGWVGACCHVQRSRSWQALSGIQCSMNEKYMYYLVLLLNMKNNTMYCPPLPLSLLNLVLSTFRGQPVHIYFICSYLFICFNFWAIREW